jgi:hypothetical protein
LELVSEERACGMRVPKAMGGLELEYLPRLMFTENQARLPWTVAGNGRLAGSDIHHELSLGIQPLAFLMEHLKPKQQNK